MYFFQKWFVVAMLLPFVILQEMSTVKAQQDRGGSSITTNNSSVLNNEVSQKNNQSEFAKSLFTTMDSNHDSSLSVDEFVTNFSYLKNNIQNVGSSNSSNSNAAKGGFWKGFTSSTMMIIATEIGDKTFFIAAVLSMRHSRVFVFGGAISALICMTILSTMMGLVLPAIIPKSYTHIIGGILFLYFGIKLIYDSKSMSDKVSDELEEVEEELSQNNKKNDSIDIESGGSATGVSTTKSNESQKVFVQAFLLTFLAEWGDRSQIATIALAAAKNPYGVTIGGCLGHSLCTGGAVLGGRILASKISEKTVSFWGGIIFLVFGIHSLFFEEAE